MANKYIALNVLDTMDNKIVKSVLNEPFLILCKNFDTEEQKTVQLNELFKKEGFFWRTTDSKWTYYIQEEDIYNFSTGGKNVQVPFSGFTDNYPELVQMSNEKRLEALEESKKKLKQLELKRSKDDIEIGNVVISGTKDSIMLNKVIFDDLMKLTPEKAKEISKSSVAETSEIVKIATNLMTDFTGGFSIFSDIVQKSNGSTINHMIRVFIMSLSFFQYYNKLINSGYAAKLRVQFESKYRDKYEKLLPKANFNIMKLERVFRGGMTSISDLETNAIGVGFLLHDIGKQVDLEYFEGAEGYVKDRIEAHVTNGFNELLKRTVYPPVVSAIAGFHHEYYGHDSGYGPLREFINRKYPDGHTCEYCISYSLHEVYNGEALCFFPAKLLEIVDVYDALTDPGRKYRNPCTPKEAVEFIRDHFLSDEIKVDPILFDMFELYLKDTGEL
ncbi:MAG: HDIG domain-containing protein [Spirochaetales bacterium]|nr:HDIG domain-containing protein [Spirochaetales bacterium]